MFRTLQDFSSVAGISCSEESFDQALEEALNRIRGGNTSGHDTNETSAFYFETTDDVPEGEQPA